MQILMAVFAAVSVLSVADIVTGEHLKLGGEFRRGIAAFGELFLSMAGMLVLAPCISGWLDPLAARADLSFLPGMLIAVDMGGAQLAAAMTDSPAAAALNGIVVASMMGCTVSFTIPFVLGTVKKELQPHVLRGLLCGIVTAPIGCIAGGIMLGLTLPETLLCLLPQLLFVGVLAVLMAFFGELCTKALKAFGILIRTVIFFGLAVGIVDYLTGWEILPGAASLEDAGGVVLNIMVVLTGAFPLMAILSRLLRRPFTVLGEKTGLNPASMMGFLSTAVNNVYTFSETEKMDTRGIVLNSAFAVSASFAFADHLAFANAYLPYAVPAMVVSKLLSGAAALLLAVLITRRQFHAAVQADR